MAKSPQTGLQTLLSHAFPRVHLGINRYMNHSPWGNGPRRTWQLPPQPKYKLLWPSSQEEGHEQDKGRRLCPGVLGSGLSLETKFLVL